MKTNNTIHHHSHDQTEIVCPRAAIVYNNTWYLLIQRWNQSANPDIHYKYEFPWWKYDENESLIDCLTREVWEETWLTIDTRGIGDKIAEVFINNVIHELYPVIVKETNSKLFNVLREHFTHVHEENTEHIWFSNTIDVNDQHLTQITYWLLNIMDIDKELEFLEKKWQIQKSINTYGSKLRHNITTYPNKKFSLNHGSYLKKRENIEH